MDRNGVHTKRVDRSGVHTKRVYSTFSKAENVDSAFCRDGKCAFQALEGASRGSLLPCANCEGFTGSGGANYKVKKGY